MLKRRPRYQLVLLLTLLFALSPSLSSANPAAKSKNKIIGDPKKGEEKAVACFSCHSFNGISTEERWPNLKGQKQAYLIKQIKDFQSGARKDKEMNDQVKGLSEKDIQDITAYFSSL